MTPGSGPPGTRVTLRARAMPAVTPLRIGMGAVRFGFEEIEQVMTDQRGEFSITVTVPAWASRELIHRFIVFDYYFVPIAWSEVFHVTDRDGILVREGEVVNPGTACPTIRSDDGLLYSLTGRVPELQSGTRLSVEARLATSSECGEGTVIQVIRIAPAHR